MATTNATIRMEKNLKKQVEVLFENMSMNITTAIKIFAKAVVCQGKIPFAIIADPFYSAYNQKYLQNTIDDLNKDKGIIVKTIEELDQMENK